MSTQGYAVRKGTEQDWPAIQALNLRNFGENMPGDAWKYHKEMLPADTYYVAEASNGDLVGTAVYFNSDINLGHDIIPMAAITEVTVAATHRGKGVLNAMFAALEEDEKFSKYPIIGLTATQATIYGRYGFGTAIFEGNYSLNMHEAALLSPVDVSESVRFLPRDKFLEELPELYKKYQRVTKGCVARPEPRWKFNFEWPAGHDNTKEAHVIVHKDGYAHFQYEDKRQELTVREVCSTTDEAYRALWQTILNHNIQKKTEFSSPVQTPLRYMLKNQRALSLTSYHDSLWLRIRDFETVASALTSAHDGELTVSILDEYGCAAGTYALEFADQKVSCAKTQGQPDVSMSNADFSMIMLGGTSATELGKAGRITGDPDKIALLDYAFFTGTAPVAGTFF